MHDDAPDQRGEYRSQLPRFERRPVRRKFGSPMQHLSLLCRGLDLGRESLEYLGRLGEELADAVDDQLLDVAGWGAQTIWGVGPALADQRPRDVIAVSRS